MHAITAKGKGYQPAEKDLATRGHGLSFFDIATGKSVAKKPAVKSFTDLFADALCEQMERDPRVVAITAAMLEGTGLIKAKQRFPDRTYDVGIAEQHAVTFAAGLACEGLRPVVAIYSTFLQRAYDQIIHDVALQQPPGDLRARPRRAGRGRRQDPPGRVRPRLPALRAEHAAHGALGRERAAPHARHRARPRRPGGVPVPARLRAWASRSTPSPEPLEVGKARLARSGGSRPDLLVLAAATVLAAALARGRGARRGRRSRWRWWTRGS